MPMPAESQLPGTPFSEPPGSDTGDHRHSQMGTQQGDSAGHFPVREEPGPGAAERRLPGNGDRMPSKTSAGQSHSSLLTSSKKPSLIASPKKPVPPASPSTPILPEIYPVFHRVVGPSSSNSRSGGPCFHSSTGLGGPQCKLPAQSWSHSQEEGPPRLCAGARTLYIPERRRTIPIPPVEDRGSVQPASGSPRPPTPPPPTSVPPPSPLLAPCFYRKAKNVLVSPGTRLPTISHLCPLPGSPCVPPKPPSPQNHSFPHGHRSSGHPRAFPAN